MHHPRMWGNCPSRAGGAVCVDDFCILGICWWYYSKPELQKFMDLTFSPIGIWEGHFGCYAVRSRCGVGNSDRGTGIDGHSFMSAFSMRRLIHCNKCVAVYAVYISGRWGFWRNTVDYFGSQVVKHRRFGLAAHQPRATVQTSAYKYCTVCLYVVKCVVHSLWLPQSVTTLS